MMAWITAPAGFSMLAMRITAWLTTVLITQSRTWPSTVSRSVANWPTICCQAAIGPSRTRVTTSSKPVSSTSTARSLVTRTSLARMFCQVSPRICSTSDRMPRKSQTVGRVSPAPPSAPVIQPTRPLTRWVRMLLKNWRKPWMPARTRWPTKRIGSPKMVRSTDAARRRIGMAPGASTSKMNIISCIAASAAQRRKSITKPPKMPAKRAKAPGRLSRSPICSDCQACMNSPGTRATKPISVPIWAWNQAQARGMARLSCRWRHFSSWPIRRMKPPIRFSALRG